MPSRPRSPKPRAGITRRPRVAGLAPVTPRPDTGSDGDRRRVGVDEPARPAAFLDDPLAEPEPADAQEDVEDRDERRDDPEPDDATAAAPADPEPARPSPSRRSTEPATEAVPAVDASVLDDASVPDKASVDAAKPARGRGLVALAARVPVLIGTFVVLMAAAVTFGVLDARLHSTPTATNQALVDVAGTAEAAGQLSDALEKVYSFDFARLDENERAAREVITPEFAAEFDRLFAEVRQRAPEQQAVVSATVTLAAVKELTEDHAVLVAFVDQQATRAAPDAESEQLAAAGRLTVTGEKVDGRWKIASVTPR